MVYASDKRTAEFKRACLWQPVSFASDRLNIFTLAERPQPEEEETEEHPHGEDDVQFLDSIMAYTGRHDAPNWILRNWASRAFVSHARMPYNLVWNGFADHHNLIMTQYEPETNSVRCWNGYVWEWRLPATSKPEEAFDGATDEEDHPRKALVLKNSKTVVPCTVLDTTKRTCERESGIYHFQLQSELSNRIGAPYLSALPPGHGLVPAHSAFAPITGNSMRDLVVYDATTRQIIYAYSRVPRNQLTKISYTVIELPPKSCFERVSSSETTFRRLCRSFHKLAVRREVTRLTERLKEINAPYVARNVQITKSCKSVLSFVMDDRVLRTTLITARQDGFGAPFTYTTANTPASFRLGVVRTDPKEARARIRTQLDAIAALSPSERQRAHQRYSAIVRANSAFDVWPARHTLSMARRTRDLIRKDNGNGDGNTDELCAKPSWWEELCKEMRCS